MDSTGALKSVLKSSSTGGGLASKVRNIEGNLRMPIRNVTFTKPLNDKVANHEVSLDDIPHVTKEKDPIQMKEKLSFASVVYEQSSKKVVKIKEMRNEISVHGAVVTIPIDAIKVVNVSVHGAVVTIPIDAIKVVNARFVNTLYGYFIGDRLAFLLVENYVKNTWAKYGLKRIQLHEEFYLFQFDTREGMENGPWLIRRVPLILNEWIPNTILKKDEIKHVPVWVKMHHVPIVAYSDIGSTYARVLIEIPADVDLMDSLVIVIPQCDREGHTFAMIKIEYEWTPPRCASCKIFDHVSDKCPKLPKEVSNMKITDDGFTEVKKKKAKGKKNNKKQVEGVHLTKPALNLQYRRVEKDETLKQKVISKENVKSVKNGNSKPIVDPTKVVDDSDSEDVDEYITMEEDTKSGSQESSNAQGASTPFEGPSPLDITMREFKECVETIEVIDVQMTGLHFTWNQKPKGKDGILRKLDCILSNLEFQDRFMGAHAMIKPYRISDHSPSVLSIPSLVTVKPKPFKFFNVAILDKRFKDVKLKGLKKPIRIMMYDKGHLHANVIRLRENLDRLQAALDNDPSNISVRKEEAVAVVAFNEAILLEEKFLKQKNDDVAKAFINHYEVFLGQAGATTSFDTNNLFSTRLDANEALDMIRGVSSQEVKSTMFSMGNEKSPGPDGFTAAFFKDTWNIIGSDVTKAIYSLKRLISPNQSAFVPGRSILDNILLTQEIMHNYHLDRGVPRCAFKTDIQKAYDTVDWEFLRATLFGFGFHDRMIAWIMEVCESSNFTNHRYCLELELINLCFTDDLFLFAHGDVYSASIIKEALDEFRDALGLNPSMPKSKAYFCNVLNHTKLAILHVLSFEEDRLPVKYLGVPLVSSRLIFRDCKELIDKIYVYKLKNRSFWDIPYRGGVLQALCVTSFHLLTLLGLALALHQRYVSAFMVRVWETIRPRDNEVSKYDLVWFSSCIPRHAVHMWLIMKKRLKMQDALSSWDVVAGLTVVCPLSETQPDSHEHLFFNCSFSHQIWSHVKNNADLSVLSSSLDSNCFNPYAYC
uniref:Reverse transcriptase domain-containing protein n=1 Tax=Tanacetum cinerariifolium TaxID=118510 RepID=A0A6L2LHU0_TANCI|nr:hypothetical protein [Tanacetum cinerariifolium]